MSKTKKIIYSIATLSGTTVGVGIFSLPYIALKTGLLVVLGYFLVLGSIVILVHLIYGELALATPDFKRLPGFAKFHLGKWGEKVSLICSMFGAYGAILAYLIVGGRFLESLLSPVLNIEANLFYTLSYFILGSVLIFFGIKIIAKIEFWGLTLFFLVLIAIFFNIDPILGMEQFIFPQQYFNISEFFLPYGAILFSLWGATLIPEVEEILGRDKKLLKKIIPISILIPIIIYVFFIYLILGITGSLTTESALTGLRDYLGNGIVNLALLLGILTTFTSFITLGLNLKSVFWYDLKIGKNWAWALTCFPPLIVFMLGLKSFITVVSLAGGVMLGFEGIIILLMYRAFLKKTKGTESNKIRFLTLPLILIFIIGLIFEIIYSIK
jgi:tyrosine-specific transport protein